ncbi:uncharacterized protein DUF2593 [Enterobacillus tribolii]|uniref:Uncharacterized protein DUF2593 n=2 Tax=Enterobacillus tribolii TaxID=1487935 RepID=A0A370QMA9_9GAMM|nr:uncharacterized protein DUF2593 [Enterobacillus tribolii]
MEPRSTKLRNGISPPVSILIAGTAIIGIRALGFLLLLHELGIEGIWLFVLESIRGWDATLLCLGSMIVLLVELGCGFAVMRGRDAGRWWYLWCQVVVFLVCLAAALADWHPEFFGVEGETAVEIIRAVILQKLPEMIILALLFLPHSSRNYLR